MWMIFIFTTVVIISSSLLSGYYNGEGRRGELIIAFSVQMALLWLGCVICWFSLFCYSRALVSLVKESVQLIGVDDESNNKRMNDILKNEKENIMFIFV
ncbi:15493_t:CDS:1, partial [Funneliformis caledonium]